jgi:hypothetical protein
MKQCKTCKEFVPLDEFHENRLMSDGHLNECKVCVGIHMATYRQTNLKKVRKQGRVNSQKYRDNHPYNER